MWCDNKNDRFYAARRLASFDDYAVKHVDSSIYCGWIRMDRRGTIGQAVKVDWATIVS